MEPDITTRHTNTAAAIARTASPKPLLLFELLLPESVQYPTKYKYKCRGASSITKSSQGLLCAALHPAAFDGQRSGMAETKAICDWRVISSPTLRDGQPRENLPFGTLKPCVSRSDVTMRRNAPWHRWLYRLFVLGLPESFVQVSLPGSSTFV